jgi:hypothetical protein
MPLPTSTRSERPRWRFLGGGILTILLAAGCGVAVSPGASPSASPPPAPSADPSGSTGSPGAGQDLATYAAIEEQVVAMRGLEARKDVEPTILDEAGLADYAQRSFAEDNPAEYVAAYERFYRIMGQLAQSEDLEQAFVKLLSSQVLGIYDPDAEALYVVAPTGAIGPTQKATYAHEFDHALQDQHFDSGALLLDGALDQSDRVLARLSLLEGDAYVLMAYWAQQNLTPAEIQQILVDAADPEGLRILRETPSVVRDALDFPATSGMLFVMDAYQRGGWDAVDAIYQSPPESTEQVMHPEKYTAGEQPVTVELPDDLATAMGTGWTVAFEDTYGEFGLRQWLRQVISDADGTDAAADVGAAGWAGDRIVFLEGPGDAYAAAIVTEWDTPHDADDFEKQANLAAAGRAGETAVLRPTDGRVVVLFTSDEAAMASVRSALGIAD